MKNINAQPLRKALDDCVRDIKRNMVSAGKVATGRTMNSLEVRVNDFGDAVNGQIVGASYFGAMETGRGPARKAGTPYQQREFIRSLMEWCRIRGVPSETLDDEQLERFAKFLKWRINKYGTELYRMGGRKDIITPAVESLYDRLLQIVSDDVSILVKDNFYKTFYDGK